jgi:glycosyltransferase involved in cell wall biosynthesis
MRLLHVLAETGFSGGEGQLQLILEHFRAAGHDNAVVLHPGARFGAVAERLGARVHWLPLRRWWRPDLWLHLRALLRRERADVLHFACGKSLIVAGLCAVGRTARLKVTVRRIDYPIRRGLLGSFRYTALVDHTVAICDAIRRRLLAAGVPEPRISRIYDGIRSEPWLDVATRRPSARAGFGIAADAQVISCVGRLAVRKGQALLLDAFAALADRFPKAVLLLAGGGDATALRRRAAQLGLERRVLLPGQVEIVQNVYAASDIFCMPSLHEGLCNACLEAGFAGLPQVVSAAGGNPEIVVDGHTGRVVPVGDRAALTGALADYLQNMEHGRRHGEAGRARCLANFTADHLGPELEALFQRLLAARP